VIRRGNLFYYLEAQNQSRYAAFFLSDCLGLFVMVGYAGQPKGWP